MARTIQCPTCKKPLQIHEEQIGQKLVCPNCNATFRVRSPGDKKSAPVGRLGTKSNPYHREQESTGPMPLSLDDDRTRLGKVIPSAGPLPSRNGGPPPLKKARREPQSLPLPRTPEPKSSGKFLTVLVVFLLLGGLGAGGWFGYQHWFARKGEQPNGKPPDSASSAKYGGIEIGSNGIKMVVVELRTIDGNIVPEVLDKNTANTGLVKSMDARGNYDPRVLERTASAVADYFNVMRKDFDVKPENIQIMCSSGISAKKPPKDASKQEIETFQASAKNNLDKLKSELKAKLDKDLDVIDAKKEAQLSFMAIVSKKEWDETLLIDIGSGNTKGGGFENKVFIDIEVKMGTQSYAEYVSKTKAPAQPFSDAVQQLAATNVAEPLRKEAEQTRTLQNRKVVQLLGGIVWVMATYTHPDKQLEHRSELVGADVAAFWSLLQIRDRAERRAQIVNKVKKAGDDKVAKAVEKDLDDIHKIFTDDELMAGAQILLAVDRQYRLEGKKIEFFRLGQYAWLLGFILDKSGQLK